MAQPFSRTTRALHASLGPRLGAAPSVGLSLALLCWLTLGEINVWQGSLRAELLGVEPARALSAAADGVVVHGALALGQAVREGDLLVELDAVDLEIQRTRAEATSAALRDQLQATDAAIGALEGAKGSASAAAGAGQDEARARAQAASAEAQLQRAEAARAEALFQRGSLSAEARDRAVQSARAASAAARAARSAASRSGDEGARERSDRSGAIEALRADAAALEAEIARADANAQELGRQLDERGLLAPVDGVVAERRPLSPGDRVRAGERLLTVLPDGPLKVVARFPPEAIGAIAVGQPARLQLDGLPDTRFGGLRAEVSAVGAAPQGDEVQVELRLLDGDPRLRHAQRGQVEVRVGAESPLRAMLRAAAGARP